MISGTFINMSIKNVAAARAFFASLGFSFNEQFSGETALAVTLNDNTAAMMLQEEFFKTFISTPLVDARKSTEVLIAIQLADRAAVDAMTAKALASGATKTREAQDLGFMYSTSFHDLDGHIWEPFWMTSEQPPEGEGS
jgi:uncharacterized protein